MAGESLLLTRVIQAASLLDDLALAALASKGLVRRARNDLATSSPRLIEPVAEKVCVQVEDCTVELAEITTQSRCTCPTAGVCRHILTAILFLREKGACAAPAGQPAISTAADEVLAVTDEALQQWAGKAQIRKAAQALANGLRAEFEDARALVIRFPAWNVTCRWLPGCGLSDMICSCHAASPCEHRVAAVMAFQAAKGGRQIVAEDRALEASAGAPRSREEVLASIGVVLREMVSLGLSRLSASTEARLRTLAVSAHGVDLPRLERMLHTLADEVALTLRRDAQASSASLLATASRIEALRSALANPSSDLVGIHRSRYEKVGDIDVVGLGARQWRSQSGYVGLTVYFWDRSLSDWATWSESRPVSVGGFDPVARYQQDGPWPGCDSPSDASRHVMRLLTTWRNPAGRLSGRPATRCVMVRATSPSELPPAITAWSELTERAGRLFAGGLQGRAERDEIVFLRPRQWGAARFDAVRQELLQPVFDSAGHSLPLIMPHTPQTESAIRILERHNPDATQALVGLVRLEHEQLAIEPVAIHGEALVNLTLDGLPPSHVAARSPTSDDEEVEEAEAEPEPPPEMAASTSSLGILLAQTAEELEAIAEGGVRSARAGDRLRTLSHRSSSLGLASIARPIARLAGELDQIRKSLEAEPSSPAGTLLRAYYVVKFAAAQEVVAGATASFGR
ncbi:MAG: SWIM zinc finger family protein [Isosphaeraceae bacterium]